MQNIRRLLLAVFLLAAPAAATAQEPDGATDPTPDAVEELPEGVDDAKQAEAIEQLNTFNKWAAPVGAAMAATSLAFILFAVGRGNRRGDRRTGSGRGDDNADFIN